MNNKIGIKNVYLYSKNLYDQFTKKEKKKRIILTTVSFFITLFSIIGIVYIITNHLAKNLGILLIVLMILPCIFLFVFLYNLHLLSDIHSQGTSYFKKSYAITNNDEIIIFYYKKSASEYSYDVLKNNLLDDMIKALVLQIRISKENKIRTEEIEENNSELDKLIKCLSIINVYNIEEKKDRIEILCDYVNLIRNTSFKNQSLTIYKYYENWEEILNKLKVQKNKIKKQLTFPDGEHINFITFVLSSSSKKSSEILFHVFFAFMLFKSINEDYSVGILLELVIAFIAGIMYLRIKAFKYSYDNDEKEFLQNKIKNNIISLGIYSILLLIYLIINTNEIHTLFITAICIFIISFIIKKRIDK